MKVEAPASGSLPASAGASSRRARGVSSDAAEGGRRTRRWREGAGAGAASADDGIRVTASFADDDDGVRVWASHVQPAASEESDGIRVRPSVEEGNSADAGSAANSSWDDIPEEPDAGDPEVFLIKLRLPSGASHVRRWHGAHALGHVAAYARAHIAREGSADASSLRLCVIEASGPNSASPSSAPASVLHARTFMEADWHTTIRASGLARRTQMIVELS